MEPRGGDRDAGLGREALAYADTLHNLARYLTGNQTDADSVPVNLDKTAPSTSANAPAGWNNHNVTVSLNAEDALSGVKATYYKLDDGAQQTGISAAINTEGVHTLQFWSVDKAGNAEAAQSVTVKIDKTAPTISHTQAPAANANGWNNSDVLVSFSCADALGTDPSASISTLWPAAPSRPRAPASPRPIPARVSTRPATRPPRPQ